MDVGWKGRDGGHGSVIKQRKNLLQKSATAQGSGRGLELPECVMSGGAVVEHEISLHN